MKNIPSGGRPGAYATGPVKNTNQDNNITTFFIFFI